LLIIIKGRSKPKSFKWNERELNPKKDRLKALLDQHNAGKKLTRIQEGEVKKLRDDLNVVL